MKLSKILTNVLTRWSLPVRGAWVEMTLGQTALKTGAGRSPCGERGLKYSPHADK